MFDPIASPLKKQIPISQSVSITAGDFTQPNLVFQIGVVPRRLDLLTSIDGVDFEAAWKSRKLVPIDDVEVPVLSLSDLKTNKRATGRLRDLADVEALEALEALEGS